MFTTVFSVVCHKVYKHVFFLTLSLNWKMKPRVFVAFRFSFCYGYEKRKACTKIQYSILEQKSKFTIFSIFISILNWKWKGTFQTRINPCTFTSICFLFVCLFVFFESKTNRKIDFLSLFENLFQSWKMNSEIYLAF